MADINLNTGYVFSARGTNGIISDGVYIVYSEDITATNFGTRYRAVITYNGVPTQTAYYSVNSYVYSKQNEHTSIRELVRALYNCGKSTVAYTAE